MNFFDKAFYLDRISEMTKLIEFRLRRDVFTLQDYDFCIRALDSLHSWVQRVFASDEYSQTEFETIISQYISLSSSVLSRTAQSEETFQVSKSAAPKQLQVFRVLGQVAQDTFPELSTSWTLTQSKAKQLFSNTRSIGGLGQ